MSIISNIVKGTDEVEGEFKFDLFESEANVLILDAATIEYAESCIEYLNSLGDAVLIQLFEACIRYCNDFLHMTGRDARVFSNPSDIIKSIQPNGLIIDEPVNFNEPIIHLEMECDWDVEHGIEIIIRNDKILYVGGFNGQDPWSEFSVNDSCNYA